MISRVVRKWPAAFVVAVLSQALFVVPASAHAAYESSDPAHKSTVSSPPSRVTVEFTEPVVAESRLEVYDACGEQVDNGDSFVAGDRITISMSGDKQGTYTVVFAVVSSVDGHPTNGDFWFSSSGGAACSQPEEEDEEEPPASEEEGSDSSDEDGNLQTSSKQAPPAAPKDGGTGDDSEVKNRGVQGRESGDGKVDAGNSNRGKVSTVQQTRSQAAIQTAPANGVTIAAVIFAVLMVLMIGSAGGFVYAGIMGPQN